MKFVRLQDNFVVEIIPIEATKPSIDFWYGSEFTSRCVEAPDEVQQHWIYDSTSKTFSAREPYMYTAEPSLEEKNRADINFLALMMGVDL